MKKKEPVVIALSADQKTAFNIAYKQNREGLLSFIRARIPRPEDADDILQDVFYQLLQSYRLTRPIESISAWLFTVARNKIIDRFRKKKATAVSEISLVSGEEASDLNLFDIIPDEDGSPEQSLAKKALMETVAEALIELPEDQRSVFIMHEYEGKSFNEIAEISGVGINTLLSRKRYAVLHLRKKLTSLYEEFIS